MAISDGHIRCGICHSKGGVEAAYPNLLLASVRTSFVGSAPAGFRSPLELQGFAAHDVLLSSEKYTC